MVLPTYNEKKKRRFSPPFTSEERSKAVMLYSKSLSLHEVAQELGRSPSGVYKILTQSSLQIRTNKKVDEGVRHEILRLYYENGMSSPEVAAQLGIAKPTVLYWLKRLNNPVPSHLRDAAGTKSLQVSNGCLDLLPFVDPLCLRWSDDRHIVLKLDNSRTAIISRLASAKDVFRVAGFYLAEGSKTSSHARIANTNFLLVELYLQLASSFVKSKPSLMDIPKDGGRAPQKGIEIGGICLKKFCINLIDGILDSFCNKSSLTRDVMSYGFDFLNGYSDGDGAVPVSRQPRSDKKRVILSLTEGRLVYASRVLKLLRRILGVGSIYRPRGRNYYLVNATLNPQNAALLLLHDFFSAHTENRRRVAQKAFDSAYMRRYVKLFSQFGATNFSREDFQKFSLDMPPDFIGRAVAQKDLIPVGVVRTSGALFHWYRSYLLSTKIQIIAERILAAAPSRGVLG